MSIFFVMQNSYLLIALSPKKMSLNQAIPCKNKGLCIPLSCGEKSDFVLATKIQ